MKYFKSNNITFRPLSALLTGAFILLFSSHCIAENSFSSAMLSPALQIHTSAFSQLFQDSEQVCSFVELSSEDNIRQNLEIFFAVSKRIKGKLLKRAYRFTRQEEREFTRWFFSNRTEQLIIPPTILKKLFLNLLVMRYQGNSEVCRQAVLWVPRFAKRWGVKDKALSTLLSWIEKNINNFEDVQEYVFFDFMREYITRYKRNHILNYNFRYLVSLEADDAIKFADAVTNMRLMTALFTKRFNTGETVFKAPIKGTNYFMGLRFGEYATSSTFVIEMLLGEEMHSHNPLAGVFFRLGFDTEGTAMTRVVQIGGVRNKKKVINDFTKKIGISPDKALLLAVLELSKEKGFKNLAGVDAKYLANAKEIRLSYRALFKSFGLTRKYSLGVMRPILMQDGLLSRWEKKAQGSSEIRAAYSLIQKSLNNFAEIPVILDRKNIEALYLQKITVASLMTIQSSI